MAANGLSSRPEASAAGHHVSTERPSIEVPEILAGSGQSAAHRQLSDQVHDILPQSTGQPAHTV